LASPLPEPFAPGEEPLFPFAGGGAGGAASGGGGIGAASDCAANGGGGSAGTGPTWPTANVIPTNRQGIMRTLPPCRRTQLASRMIALFQVESIAGDLTCRTWQHVLAMHGYSRTDPFSRFIETTRNIGFSHSRYSSEFTGASSEKVADMDESGELHSFPGELHVPFTPAVHAAGRAK
jgi:hypothetical protein